MKIADIPPFGLRLRPDLKMRLEVAARRNNRSLNSEIVGRLEQSLDRDIGTQTLEERIRALEASVKALQLQLPFKRDESI